ncbi:hypothetical protein VTI74DRAFT_11589 [Chaetomium olivicolor]
MPVEYPHMRFPRNDGDGEKGQFREPALVHTLICHESSNFNSGTVVEAASLFASFPLWLLVALGQVFAGCLLQEGDEGYSAEWVAECEERKKKIGKVIGGMGPRILMPDLEALREHGEALAKAKRGEGKWPDVVTSRQEFKDHLRRVMLYRSLFKTEEGWIEVCCETCQVGDEVWLLEGGTVPYVLRRRSGGDRCDEFVFRGECYVHGAMNGEVVKDDGKRVALQEMRII